MSVAELQKYTAVSKYACHLEELNRREIWPETVGRSKGMMKVKYPTLSSRMDELYDNYVLPMKVMPSMRGLQFGGYPVLKRHERLYNCISSYVDRLSFFGHALYLLLCGSGVGCSVQNVHLSSLPAFSRRRLNGELLPTKIYKPDDSIEGWANCAHVLATSYHERPVPGFEEYLDCNIQFDYSGISKKGTALSNGVGKTPGPMPLAMAMKRNRDLLESAIANGDCRMTDVVASDFHLNNSDAAVSGGHRRCIAAGSRVIVKDKGFIGIEEVVVGDNVSTMNGWKRVTKTFRQGLQDVVKIQHQDGYLVCTPNHKVAVLNDLSGSFDWKEASTLSEGDRLLFPKNSTEGINCKFPEFSYIKPEHSTTCKDIVIPEITPEIAWFIGQIQGNGHVRLTSGKGCVDIAVAGYEPHALQQIELLSECFRKFGVNFHIITPSPEDNCFKIRAASKQLALFMYDNVKQTKTTLRIPDFIKCGNESIRAAYLQGILDSDGAHNNKPPLLVTTVYPEFALDIKAMAATLGINTRYIIGSDSKSRIQKGWQPLYHIGVIRGSDRAKYTKLTENIGFRRLRMSKIDRYGNGVTFEMAKKYIGSKIYKYAPSTNNSQVSTHTLEKMIGELNYVPIAVKSVVSFGQAYTYDIEVEDQHSFVCEGILVHNSANILIFDITSEGMLNYKVGNWREKNPQRARANISAALIRNKTKWETFNRLFNSTKEFGEPGFWWTDSEDNITNPCFSGDTKILTDKGYVAISEMAKNDLNHIIIDNRIGKGNIVYHELSGTSCVLASQVAITKKDQDLFRIQLKCGYYVDATEDHLFPTRSGRVKLKDLKVRDILYVNHENCSESEVMSIKWIAKEDVYCLCQPLTNTVIANGIIAGNCAEIAFYCRLLIEAGHHDLAGLLKNYDGPILDINGKKALSGFQACNLTTQNGRLIKTEQDLYEFSEIAAEIGTYQAGFTNFPYLGPITEEIVRKEALLGVSIAGFMHNPEIMLNKEILRNAVSIIKLTNEKIAHQIGINSAARLTCVKPDGNSASALGTFSGCHPGKIRRGFRIAQANKDETVYKYFKSINPQSCEESAWSANKTDDVIRFCVDYDGLLEDNMTATEFLGHVRTIQENWVEPGTVKDRCVNEGLRHNTSNTVKVRSHEWGDVAKYIFDHKDIFGGVSFISEYGDRDYPQAPFTGVYLHGELLKMYGEAVLECVDTILKMAPKGPSYELWNWCDIAQGIRETQKEAESWCEILKTFAEQQCGGDIRKMIYAVKDLYNLRLYNQLKLSYREVDYSKMVCENTVNLQGEIACGANGCET